MGIDWPDFLEIAQEELRPLTDDGYEVRPERKNRGWVYVAYIRGLTRIEVQYDIQDHRDLPRAVVARAHSWTGWAVPGTSVDLDTQPEAAVDIPDDPSDDQKLMIRSQEERRLHDFCRRLLGELRQRGLTSR